MDELTLALEQAQLRRSLPRPAERRRLRRRAGLTQEVVARALGVTPVSVCRWERGVRTPRAGVLALYLRVLDQLAASARLPAGVRTRENAGAAT